MAVLYFFLKKEIKGSVNFICLFNGGFGAYEILYKEKQKKKQNKGKFFVTKSPLYGSLVEIFL